MATPILNSFILLQVIKLDLLHHHIWPLQIFIEVNIGMPIPNCHTIFCLRMIEVSNEMKIIKELHKVENNIKYLIDNENLKMVKITL